MSHARPAETDIFQPLHRVRGRCTGLSESLRIPGFGQVTLRSKDSNDRERPKAALPGLLTARGISQIPNYIAEKGSYRLADELETLPELIRKLRQNTRVMPKAMYFSEVSLTAAVI